ncbi:MAG: hypothetical protein LBU64_11385 [Planctomycetota bacterium]|jgi:hypothetical protein|nr:hypothetical protein [Planctomycetota bacterium]
MSIFYWTAQKFGVIIGVFYLAAAGIIIIPEVIPGGAVDPGLMARVYPPGSTFAAADPAWSPAGLFGWPEDLWPAAPSPKKIGVVSYSGAGVVLSFDGGPAREVTLIRALGHLGGRNPAGPGVVPDWLRRAGEYLLDIHRRVLARLQEAVSAWNPGEALSAVLPKLAVAMLYCGAVAVIWYCLAKSDHLSNRKNGFSLIYSALILWPAAVAGLSLAGVSLAAVLQNLPDSPVFFSRPLLAAWGAVLAWPALVGVLSILEVLRDCLNFHFSLAVSHALVLAVGIVSLPLATLGALFAVLALALYLALKIGRRGLGALRRR